jgi:hypothetical protein
MGDGGSRFEPNDHPWPDQGTTDAKPAPFELDINMTVLEALESTPSKQKTHNLNMHVHGSFKMQLGKTRCSKNVPPFEMYANRPKTSRDKPTLFGCKLGFGDWNVGECKMTTARPKMTQSRVTPSLLRSPRAGVCNFASPSAGLGRPLQLRDSQGTSCETPDVGGKLQVGLV